jgi:hypothetical protein
MIPVHDAVEAFDFNKRKLIQLSPNWAMPVPLSGEAAFLTLSENRHVEIQYRIDFAAMAPSLRRFPN